MKLTVKEEQEYIKLYYTTGLKKYKDSVILSQKTFIHLQAAKYSRYNKDFYHDLMQVGWLQAVIAFNSYKLDNPTNAVFRGYCRVAVTHAIGEYAARNSSMLSLGCLNGIKNIDFDGLQAREHYYSMYMDVDNTPTPFDVILENERQLIARELFK